MSAIELASGTVSIGADTSAASKNITGMFAKTESTAIASASRAGKGIVSTFGSVIAPLSGIFTGAMGPLLGATAGIAGLSATLLAVSSDFGAMGRAIKTTTGAVGADLDSLKASAKEVGKTVPQSFTEVGQTLADLRVGLGITGKPLESLTTQVLNLSRMTGLDLKSGITDITRTFNDWGVSVDKQSGLLDYMFKTSQATGSGVDQLTQRLVQFGAPLRTMGFDVKTSTALLGLFQKTGANTELVLGSMRIALGNFVKQGKDAPTALRETIKQIKDMPDASKAAALSMQIFGKRAGADMADSIRGGKFELDGLLATLDSSTTTINGSAKGMQTMGVSLGILKNQIMAGLEPLATAFVGQFSNTIKWLVNEAVPAIKQFAGSINFDSGPIGFLVDRVIGLKNNLADLFGQVIPAVEKFKPEIELLAIAVGATLYVAVTSLTTVISALVDGLTNTFNFVDKNKTVFSTIAGVITGLLIPAMYAQVTAWAAAGTAALISGGETVAIWTLIQASAIKGAAISLASSWKVVGGWVLMAAKATISAITMAAAWVIALGPIALIVAGIALVVGAFVALWVKCDWFRNFWIGLWDWIKNAAVNAWTSFLKPTFDALVAGFNVISTAVLWWWHNVMELAFNAIGILVSLWWNYYIMPIFESFKFGLNLLISAILFWWHSVVEPAFNAVGSIISFWWNNIVKPAFDLFKGALDFLGVVISTWWNGVKIVWTSLGDTIAGVISNIIVPAFETFKRALSGVQDFFGTVVNGIKTAWDGIKSATATPINFIINTVWNNGLLKAWNSVAGWLPGLKKAEPLAPIAFARGGATSGGSPGKDSIPALLMPGEHVFDTEDVAKLGGQQNVYALRSMIERGIPFSWDEVTGLTKAGPGVAKSIATAPAGADMAGFLRAIGTPGYKDGGAVRPAWELQLENGHRAAQGRNGNPYTWGFEDCSGYMSMIADAILRGGNGVRRWATSSFPGGQPWVPGLGQGFSVGVHDDPGGAGGGHTAGTLSAVGSYGTVNVESGGSHGNVAYGGPAAGADSAQWNGVSPGRFHLAIGADGAFEAAAGSISPAVQTGFLRDKVLKVINGIMDPVRSTLPNPPPAMLGWPRTALDTTVKAAVDGAMNVTGNLGTGLRSAFDSAKGAITSVFRDQGGFIWPGLNMVRNETGKPEAVLNWDQLDKVTGFLDKASGIAQSSLFEILNPGGILPNPQELANRYTIRAEDFQPSGDKPGGGSGDDFSINIAQLVVADPREQQKALQALQTRQSMKARGRP